VIHVTTSFGRSTTEAFILGKKGAIMDRDKNWKSLEETERGPGFGRYTAARIRGVKTPVVEALKLIDAVDELREVDGVFMGEFSEVEAVKLAGEGSGFGRRRGRETSEVIFAKATVKFWIKDGILTQFEHFLDASIDSNGNERVTERTTTTALKDIGTTKFKVPKGAEDKLKDH
jgi:hypothetical protein